MQAFLKTKAMTYNLSERTHIMGILNVTPDSFSDGGSYITVENAVAQAVEMEKLGADIIDIGGESTRPNHQAISKEEEIKRIVPAIKAVKEAVTIPISIDTYKAETARAAIDAGASIINDVWGAKREPEIADVAAEYDVPLIIMHNRTDKNYFSLIDDMKQDLHDSIEIALKAGVRRDNIILDPGIGFAKTITDNLVTMNHLEKFVEMGYPVLLGASRKSFIGHILDVPPAERDNGTGATTCMAIQKGVQIVRVHDVKRTAELAKMMDRMLAGGK
ncbi:dihydropteroate synthase [Virgibacillus phasianinus]|uniref:Dihydropteroate synthase n=2 Tax=Virgibacillus phasianinus TaxID=2017483 RepID=A0A220U8S4_9BACI|nr:dihydropteroate synthase [Virgibacillus phasianinus]ASK64296.1 dihydropteroate synthase [Virgibacillus phasianinus]